MEETSKLARRAWNGGNHLGMYRRRHQSVLGDVPDLQKGWVSEEMRFNQILTSQRDERARLPSAIVVLTIRSLSSLKEQRISAVKEVRERGANVTAGAWNKIWRDCETPRSPLPVVARLSKAIGIEEQLGANEVSQQETFGRNGTASNALVNQQRRTGTMHNSESVQHICTRGRK